jgi:hypothetical protein
MSDAGAVPASDVASVKETLERCFPDYWPAVDLCLSTCATLLLKENVNPTAVILVGGPATGKTTVASMFEGALVPVGGGKIEPLVYRTDKFTPASFVSQAANRTSKDLAKVDLLPRITNKVLLTPELAPIFRGKAEDLVNTFSIITRVLDGDGYTSDSGTHGQRGYVGRHLFAWIGCTTPFERMVWQVMSQLGSRLFFLLMETGQELTWADLLTPNGESYQSRRGRCREAVHVFLRSLFGERGGFGSVTWDAAADDRDGRMWLARCAALLAKMRSTPAEDREGTRVSYRPGVPEAPYRALNVLTNVARGHALVHGRAAVSMADLPLIAQVTLSSMPHDIRRILAALINQRVLTAKRVCEVLGAKHPETARKPMDYMRALGVARFEEPGPGKEATLSLLPEWEWCASDEFRALLGLEPVTGEGVCAPTAPVTDQEVCDPDEPVTDEELCEAVTLTSSPEFDDLFIPKKSR